MSKKYAPVLPTMGTQGVPSIGSGALSSCGDPTHSTLPRIVGYESRCPIIRQSDEGAFRRRAKGIFHRGIHRQSTKGVKYRASISRSTASPFPRDDQAWACRHSRSNIRFCGDFFHLTKRRSKRSLTDTIATSAFSRGIGPDSPGRTARHRAHAPCGRGSHSPSASFSSDQLLSTLASTCSVRSQSNPASPPSSTSSPREEGRELLGIPPMIDSWNDSRSSS